MAGSTGERPLGDIVADVEFWKLHVVNIPAILISGFLFVSTGLAYDIFGTPRPDEYFQSRDQEIPLITDRNGAKAQLDQFTGQATMNAPEITTP